MGSGDDCGGGADTLEVDLTLCVGHGKCYLLAPDLFEPRDDEGRARVVAGPIPSDDETRVKRAELAIEACPEGALRWAHGRRAAPTPPAADDAIARAGLRLHCPCGELLLGADEDALVHAAEDHLRSAHPSMADAYTREQILSMAF